MAKTYFRGGCFDIKSSMICHYYVTYNCNCKCDYCSIWQDKSIDQGINASLNDIENNIISLKRIGVKKVLFTGGEPFLFDGLYDALKISKNNDFEVLVSTNGLNASKNLRKVSNFIDCLFVSLSYPIEEEHNKIKSQECFVEALDTIISAKYLGIEVVIDYVLTRDSVRFLPELAELLTENKIKARIIPVHHCLPLEGFEQITIDYIKRYEKNKMFIMSKRLLNLLKNGGNNIHKPSCRVLENVLSISPDNNLILPCFWIRQSFIPINADLDKIIYSKIVESYRKMQGRLYECKGCTAIEMFNDQNFSQILDYEKFSGIINWFKNLLLNFKK